MEQEHNQKRIVTIYQMLFEIARGNFSMRIPQSSYDDDLETLVVLINMVAEELKASVFHSGYVNPRSTYRFIAHAILVIGPEGHILTSNSELQTLLGYTTEDLQQLQLADLLTPKALETYEQALTAFSNATASQVVLPLEFLTKNDLHIHTDCTLVRLDGRTEFILSFITPLTAEPHLSSHKDDSLFKNRTARQTDALLIQKLYDYILANLDEPLPSLKALARQFGTNEFKLKSGFRHFFKTSIYKFYTQERIKRAHMLILHSDLPLKHIAIMCGFSNYPNFSKTFKRHYGYWPNELKSGNAIDESLSS